MKKVEWGGRLKNMGRSFYFSEGEFYHVFNRGVEKRMVFVNEKDKKRFQKLLYLCNGTRVVHFSVLKDFEKDNSLYQIDRGEPLVALGAYCLMGNHFHLLLREIQSGGISRFMQKLSTAYTMYFNILNERTGSLFENRFRARHASNDRYLKYLFSYIHLNPAQHVEPNWKEEGIISSFKTWQYVSTYSFSSLEDYLGEKRAEQAILSTIQFPGYFKKRGSMRAELYNWLNMRPNDFKVEP